MKSFLIIQWNQRMGWEVSQPYSLSRSCKPDNYFKEVINMIDGIMNMISCWIKTLLCKAKNLIFQSLICIVYRWRIIIIMGKIVAFWCISLVCILNIGLIVYKKVFHCHFNFDVAILTRSPTLSSNNKFDTIDKILYCYH